MSDLQHGLSLIEEAQVLQEALPHSSLEWRMENVEAALLSLGRQAENRGEVNSLYLIDTRVAFGRGQRMEQGKHRIFRLGDVAVEGRLKEFSYIQIGKLGATMVSSLCVDLDAVKMLPGGDSLPAGDVLHIPVLAVEQALRVA